MNEYKLLTPGPISTSEGVKKAMMKDQCTWDKDYQNIVGDIQERLLDIAHCSAEEYTCILVSGSGTYANEAVISSVLSENDKLLVISSGVYGARLGILADYADVDYIIYDLIYDRKNDYDNIERILKEDSKISHIVMVDIESTFGFKNDLEGVSELSKKYNKNLLVDAMSSFGAIDMDIPELGIDFIITTPNKAIEAIPGIAIVIAKNDVMDKCEGNASTLSLDLYKQYLSMKKSKFRFTSPTYNVLALHQALTELEIEGGVEKRYLRYQKINNMIKDVMAKYKIYRFVESDYQSVILNCFSLDNQVYEFEQLYNFFRVNGYELYPAKMTAENNFRIGNIGKINEDDVLNIDKIMKDFYQKMNIEF